MSSVRASSPGVGRSREAAVTAVEPEAPSDCSPWRLSFRADPRANAIAKRHYNCQSLVPPGKCYVLLTDNAVEDDGALWVTSWPKAEFVKHAWAGAWVNSTFRCERPEEGDTLPPSSDLIRLAVAHTLARWPDVPDLGLVTFVDPNKVPGTKVRGEVIYGYAYLKAGFEHVGFTKAGLWTWQLLPARMPAPLAVPMPGTLDFEEVA